MKWKRNKKSKTAIGNGVIKLPSDKYQAQIKKGFLCPWTIIKIEDTNTRYVITEHKDLSWVRKEMTRVFNSRVKLARDPITVFEEPIDTFLFKENL